MEKNTIITLEDNEKYLLLDKVEQENSSYFLALMLTELDEPTKQYEIFEEEIEDGVSYMSIVDNPDLKEMLMIKFTQNYQNEIAKEEE